MKKTIVIALGLVYAAVFSFAISAQQRADDGPRFKDGNMLVRPADYREWMFLSSGIGMTYAAGTPANAPQNFGNVYVNPSSYRRFMQTGQWPDRTIFVLEQRASATEGSIVKGGRFQTTLAGIEAEIKDVRVPGGWARSEERRVGKEWRGRGGRHEWEEERETEGEEE